MRQVKALSGNTITVVESAGRYPVTTARDRSEQVEQPCRHRGNGCGETSMRGCCGRTFLAPARECMKLKTRCVLMGDPIALDVAICSSCTHREK